MCLVRKLNTTLIQTLYGCLVLSLSQFVAKKVFLTRSQSYQKLSYFILIELSSVLISTEIHRFRLILQDGYFLVTFDHF